MIGTPMYMSPEQAELNNLDIDTRTDVYSLGVVLYEILVGTTPLELMQLQTAAYDEVLRLIKEVEPPRPSIRLSASTSLPSIAAQRSIDPRELRRTLAGELDWIVMKTLEKERSRRYETATALASDIQRYLIEEAVEACPPSRSYQLKKFIRKHKGKVIATAAVLCTLLLGLIGTTWQSYRATRAERAAIESKQAAVASEQKTLEALGQVTLERDEKELARRAEAKQREIAERRLAEGILRPVGFGFEPNSPELNAFVEWTSLADDRLKQKVLEIAFEDPDTALRVASRSNIAMQACVTLSPTRRQTALEFLTAKQRDTAVLPAIRVAACWLSLELGDRGVPALEESLAFLSQPSNGNSKHFESFLNVLLRGASSQKQVARICDVLIETLGKSKDEYVLEVTVNALASLAPRLETTQVTRAWESLIDFLVAPREYSDPTADIQTVISQTGVALVALVPRLNQTQVMKAWSEIIEITGKSFSFSVHRATGNAMVALVSRLDQTQVPRCADALIEVLETSKNSDVLAEYGKSLAFLAPQLDRMLVDRAWSAMVQVLGNSTDYNVLSATGNALVALVPQLNEATITPSWHALIDILNISKVEYVLITTGETLHALAPRLETTQIPQAWDALANFLVTPPFYKVPFATAQARTALASRLDTRHVMEAGDTLIDILSKATNADVPYAIGETLVAIAPQLDSTQVSRAVDVLMEVQGKPTNYSVDYAIREFVALLLPLLEPVQVKRIWDTQIEILGRTTDVYDLNSTGEVLASLAPHLDPTLVTHAWGSLIEFLGNSTNYYVRAATGKAVVQLVPRLEQTQVAKAWDRLVEILDQLKSGQDLIATSNALALLAPRLDSTQIERAWKSLVDSSQRKELEPWVIDLRAKVLVALAPRVAAEQRVAATEWLSSVFEGSNTASDGWKTYSQLAMQLDRVESEKFCTMATGILLDGQCAWEGYFYTETMRGYSTEPLQATVTALRESRGIAKLLSHPGSWNEPQNILLQRFEELVLHEGRRVHLPLPKFDDESKVSTADNTNATSTDATDVTPLVKTPRQFHTIHDASDWIAENWPDFDLEATHPVTYYPDAR